MRRLPSSLPTSLCAALLTASLVAAPCFAWTSPRGVQPVQAGDVDLDDLFVDDFGSDDEDQDLPDGDADMPMGDYDLEHGTPEPEPEPPPRRRAPPPEPPPARRTPPETVREPPPPTRTPPENTGPRRMLLDGDPPSRSDGPRVPLTRTEEIGTIGGEEPSETEGGTLVLWTVAGVGAAVGVAALVGAGVGAYFLLGGLGGPTGSVTVTPH